MNPIQYSHNLEKSAKTYKNVYHFRLFPDFSLSLIASTDTLSTREVVLSLLEVVLLTVMAPVRTQRRARTFFDHWSGVISSVAISEEMSLKAMSK